TWDGICLWNVSGNTVRDNLATDNEHGITVWPGTNNNQIFLNNFYDNQFNGLDDSTANTWTTGSPSSYYYNDQLISGILGNYWGDYDGADMDANGIGDTPYTVNVTDPAPLMGLWNDGTIAYIPAAPVAAFSADVLSGVAPLTIQFTDESSNAPTSWFWDFGDDATAELQPPAHTYDRRGMHPVTRTVDGRVGSASGPPAACMAVLVEA